MLKRAGWLLWVVGIVLSVSVFSSFGSGDRMGTSITQREIINGHLANEGEVLAALVSSDSLGYVSEITFHGVDVQLGVLDSSLQGFPVDGTACVAMSNGQVNDIPGQAPTFISTYVNGVNIPGGSPDGFDAYDVATLTLHLDLTGVSASDNPKLVFYFKFMSEEVPTFVGSGYQDFFTVHVYNANGAFVENIARLPDGSPFTIDNAWPLMNQVGGGSQNPSPPYPDPNDVTFNGCTDIRPVEFDLSGLAGQTFTMEFQIGDVSDGIYDSAVFLDGLSISTQGNVVGDHIDLGFVTVYGDNVVQLDASGNSFRVEGNVHIDDVLRFSGDLEVNTLTKTITGNCKVWFEDPNKAGKFTMPEIDISDVAVQFFIDASQKPIVLQFAGQIKELSFKVAGVTVLAKKIQLYFNDPQYGYGLKADVYLSIENIKANQVTSGPKGELFVEDLYATSLLGIGFESAKIQITNATLNGGFKINTLVLEYTSATDTFSAQAQVVVPAWQSTIDGHLVIIAGALDTIGLGYESSTGIMLIPLPTPPSALYLQHLQGELANLTSDEPSASAGFSMTYGLEVEFGSHKLHLLRFDVNGTIGNGFFTVTGTVSVFWEGGKISDCTVAWHQSKGVTVDGSLDLAGILQGDLHAIIDPNDGTFRAHSTVQATIPEGVPLIGNKPLGSVSLGWENWDIGFEAGVDLPWPVGWCVITVLITPDPECPYCQDCWFGFPVPFTPISIYAGCNLDELLGKSLSSDLIGTLASAKAPYQETFYVPGGKPFILARLDGVDGSIPYFELLDPFGVVITPQIASQNAAQYVYSENSAIGEAWIAVKSPVSGTWTLRVPGTELQALALEEGTLAVQAFGALPPPTINMIDPSVSTTTTEMVDISWQGTSTIPDATVELYCITDKDYAGVLIAKGLPVSGSYSWNVHGTAPGTYHIYGVISDGRNAPKNTFASATVTIEKDPPQANLQGPSQVLVGDNVVLDAANSVDPWGMPLNYGWTVLQVPDGSGAGLNVTPDQDSASFVPDIPGTYLIQVLVRDPFGAQDLAQITVQAISSATTLSVPQVGTISFVGSDFSLIATITDQAGNAVTNKEVHFDVISGPHVGTVATATTDLAGKAAFAYTGISEGVDTIQVWSGATTYGEADTALRSEIGHVWIHNGDCVTQSVDLTPAGWRMTALPGELCSSCLWAEGAAICGDLVCALSDDLDPCFIFHYDPGIGGYVMAPPADSICYHAGMGFWTRTYENNVTIDAEVQVPTEAVEISLGNGWNQIGNPFPFAVPANALKVRCGDTELSLLDAQAQGWVSAYLFGYATISGGYVMIDPASECLQPWSGYWIRSYQDGCVLIIPPTVYTGLSTAGQPLSVKELEARGLELPPPPPNDLMSLNVKDVLASLTVRNVPNPIRSQHTTTFKVEGKGAELVQAMRVDIYALSGRRVFTQTIAAKELAWHTVNDAGEVLANGVYLYQVWVKIGGEWYPTGIKKLAVVR